MGRLVNKNRIMPLAFQVALGLWMIGVILAAFLYLPNAAGFTSPKIVIFHVPCAMIAVTAYLISMIYAVSFLKKRDTLLDIKSAVSASLGFLFTILATITGMIFAKVEWGTAWNWDPRETSILMLLVVYAAYFALRSSISGPARARVSAAYNILAGIVMPFLVFVLPRMTSGLHPTNTLSHGGLSPEYRIVMICSMVGYVGIYVWIFRLQVRLSEYELSRRKKRNV